MPQGMDTASLLRVLQVSSSSKERQEAIRLLEESEDSRAIDALLTALKQNHWEVRWLAARALGRLGDKRAVERLRIVELLDSDAAVRKVASNALSDLGIPDAIVPDVIKQLATALNTIGYAPDSISEIVFHNKPLTIDLLIAEWEGGRREAAKSALLALGSPAAEGLRASLNLDLLIATLLEEDAREGAGTSFGSLRSVRNHASSHVQGSSGLAREDAATILGYLRDERAVSSLIAASRDDDLAVASSAVEALGKFDDARVIEHLNELTSHSRGEVRLAAAKALGELKHISSLGALVALLNEENQAIQWQASQSLAALSEQAIVPLINELPIQNERVRHQISNILASIGDAAVSPLLDALHDADWRVREGAAKSL